MGVPAHLQPIAYDARAAEDVVASARALERLLAEVLHARQRLVLAAVADWWGPNRDTFDDVEADVELAAEQARDLLAQLRSGIASDVDDLVEDNRRRAEARREWELAQQAPVTPTVRLGGVR